MKKFSAYLVKFLEYIFDILKRLDSFLFALEEKRYNEQKKPTDSNQKTENEQEGPKFNEVPTKPMLDEKRLNYLENKSYFLANVGTVGEFDTLSEEIKTLYPNLFKKQFPKVIKDKGSEVKSEAHTEKTTKVANEKHQQRKNELMNKVTFIVNKCGTSSDFEKLPDEVKVMDPALFKEKSKDCKF